MRAALFPALAASLLAGAALAQPQARGPAEPAMRFAQRVLGLAQDAEGVHLTDALWNGRRTLFVDFPRGEEREVVALRQQPDGRYRRYRVTTGEEEGGMASVAAIGFANADHDPRRELVVILTWPVGHYDVGGTLYEVRVLDDPAPGRDALAPLPAASRLFAANACDCDWRDGTRARFRFKTIAAVRRRLRRAGY